MTNDKQGKGAQGYSIWDPDKKFPSFHSAPLRIWHTIALSFTIVKLPLPQQDII